MGQGGPTRDRLVDRVQRVLESRVLLLVALGILGGATYVVHVWMLGRYAAPPSGDYGIYLADAHALAGTDVTGFGSAYPPVFLIPLLGLLTFVDPVTAVRLLTPVGLLILPFPFYRIVSRYAGKPWAFLGTALFLLNEGYSEMAGWGGGPDLLATAFMLASLAFFLQVLDSPNRRNLILAGLFAGLVVGTHHLTALVYVLALLLWMALETLRLRSLRAALPFLKLAGWSALFSLPFAPYYLGFAGGIAPQITPVWPEGVQNLVGSTTFLFRSSPILWLVVGVLAVAAGVRWLRDRPEGSLMLSLTVISVLLAIAALQDNPTRSLYYLYIPLLGTFPAFFRWAPTPSTPDVAPKSRRAVVALLVVFAVASSAVFAGQSMQRMSVAIDWYHAINAPELQAMDWLRTNTSADSVVATAGVPFDRLPEGTRFAWWIEGYAERRSFYGGSPIYASLSRERAMVEEANLYFAGNYGAEGTDVRFVDNAPAALANPGISVTVPSGFESAFFMSDADTVVSYSTGPGTNLSWSPYFAVPTVHPSWTGPGSSVLTVPRSDANVSFIRNETLTGSSVEVSLDIRPAHGTLTSVSVPVWVGWSTWFSTYAVQNATVTGVLEDSAGDVIPFEVSVGIEPTASLTVSATARDPRWGQPAILVDVLPDAPLPALVLSVRLTFPSASPSPLRTWDAFAIGASYGVGYVFWSRRLAEGYYRFSEDLQHFRLVYENDAICIYQVVPP